MNMIKILTLIALVSGLLINNPAWANLIVIDDFSVAQGPLADRTANGVGETLINSVRTLTHQWLIADPMPTSRVQIGAGYLDANNGAGEDSQVIISWLLNPGLLPATIINPEYAFAVIKVDDNATNIHFSFNNIALANFMMPGPVNNQFLSFAMDDIQQANLNLGGVLQLKIDGSPGWDMKLDTFGFFYSPAMPVPEFSLSGLIAFGLAGLGFSRTRKRKFIGNTYNTPLANL
ncbi:hypothetical protein [Crenothrix sp.]|uniref:hypothetical protein n=1 Tax=Crenothrix sp. TaxID=3100433 RepID=UPI00374C9243